LDFVDPNFAHQGFSPKVVPQNYEISFFHEMRNEDINPLKNPLVYLVGGIVIIK
jgi:hypothetical protein